MQKIVILDHFSLQEFMILPTGATSFTEAMKMGSETYHHLKALIKEQYGLDATAVGDEGGFAPNFQNNEDAIKLCVGAIEKAGYTGKIQLGMDVAASEFHKEGKYDLDFKNKESDPEKWISPDALCDMYKGFISDFPGNLQWSRSFQHPLVSSHIFISRCFHHVQDGMTCTVYFCR